MSMINSFQTITVPDDLAIEKFTSWIRHSLSNINSELTDGKLAHVVVEIPTSIFSRLIISEVDQQMIKEVNRHKYIQRINLQEI